ncbi:hypothetical protein SRHO_G00186970 [Serrasalmus rhombeus]
MNVRGLPKATKRTAVFRDLASTFAAICCLQEVHLRDQRDEALFSQEWRRGDFNINLEVRDDVSVKHFKKLVAGFSLIDGFKFINPGNPGHTWHNSRGAYSRIDYILVAPPITVRTFSLSPRWYSDHMMVEATVSIDAPSFGRGYWKLNVEILEEREYQILFRDRFAAWLGCKSDFASPAAWWEHIKERIRALTIHYCSQRKAAKLQRVRDLEKQLKKFYADYNNGGALDLDRAQALRAELRALHEWSAADSLFNARLQMAEENETCSAFFFKGFDRPERRDVLRLS